MMDIYWGRVMKIILGSGVEHYLQDPVYVEAFLQVNQFDLIVELLVINRTTETLQNVNVELCTHGNNRSYEL